MLTEEQRQLLRAQILANQQDEGPSIEDLQSDSRRNHILAAIGMGLSTAASAQAAGRGLPTSNFARDSFKDLGDQSSQSVRDAILRKIKLKESGAKSAQEMLSEDAKQQAAAELKNAEITAANTRSREDRTSREDIAEKNRISAEGIANKKIAADKTDAASKPTAGQKATDESFGKETGESLAKGSSGTVQDNMRIIDKSIKALKDSKEGGLGDRLQGAMYSAAPASVASAFASDFAMIEADVRDATFNLLKEILGGQFAVKETEMVMKNTFNPSLGNDNIAIRLQEQRNKMQAIADSKEAARAYFNEHKTLDGFVPPKIKPLPTAFPVKMIHPETGRTATINTPGQLENATGKGFVYGE